MKLRNLYRVYVPTINFCSDFFRTNDSLMSIVQSGILRLCVMCNEIKSCRVFFLGRGEAHFVGIGAEEQEIEGDGSHEVDKKPAP